MKLATYNIHDNTRQSHKAQAFTDLARNGYVSKLATTSLKLEQTAPAITKTFKPSQKNVKKWKCDLGFEREIEMQKLIAMLTPLALIT